MKKNINGDGGPVIDTTIKVAKENQIECVLISDTAHVFDKYDIEFINNIYLSKSKYCRAKKCNKILWMDKYKSEFAVQTADDMVLENGIKVGELAKQILGEYINIEFNENLNKMLEDTLKHMKNAGLTITAKELKEKARNAVPYAEIYTGQSKVLGFRRKTKIYRYVDFKEVKHNGVG